MFVTRKHLTRRQQAEQHTIAQAPRSKQPMKSPERERQELCLLQLHMRVVVNPVRQKREHDTGYRTGPIC